MDGETMVCVNEREKLVSINRQSHFNVVSLCAYKLW